jgi:hypothetical protein
MQIGWECSNELEALVEAPHVKDMVIEPPGQAILSIGPVQESFIELGIPPTHDSAVSAPAVELSQDVEQWRGRVYRLTGNFVDGGSTLGVFNVSGVDQGMEAFGLTFTVSLEDTGDFDDTMLLDIEPGGFQIDKDELRHACFRLLWSYRGSKLC